MKACFRRVFSGPESRWGLKAQVLVRLVPSQAELGHQQGEAVAPVAGQRLVEMEGLLFTVTGATTTATPTQLLSRDEAATLSPASGLRVPGTPHKRGYSHPTETANAATPVEVDVQKR